MVLASEGDTSLLLGAEDVPPVWEENAAGRSPFLLTCDHYGRLIPRMLGDLGAAARALSLLPGDHHARRTPGMRGDRGGPPDDPPRHIAWDIGIAGVAEA